MLHRTNIYIYNIKHYMNILFVSWLFAFRIIMYAWIGFLDGCCVGKLPISVVAFMCLCDSNDWVQFEQLYLYLYILTCAHTHTQKAGGFLQTCFFPSCTSRWSNQLSNIPAHLWLEHTPKRICLLWSDSTCGVIAEVLPDLVNPMVKEMIALGHLAAIYCLNRSVRSLP